MCNLMQHLLIIRIITPEFLEQHKIDFVCHDVVAPD